MRTVCTVVTVGIIFLSLVKTKNLNLQNIANEVFKPSK
jgi:hypothetical protein